MKKNDFSRSLSLKKENITNLNKVAVNAKGGFQETEPIGTTKIIDEITIALTIIDPVSQDYHSCAAGCDF